MDPLRIFQRHALESFLRSRSIQPKPNQIRHQTSTLSRMRTITKPAQARSLHIPRRVTTSTSRNQLFSRLRTRMRNFASTTAEQTENLSLSQRLRKLSREYGWSAAGVYFALSAADFPFCYLAVSLLGTDRIGHWEHVVVSWAKEQLGTFWPQGADALDNVEGQGKRILEEGVRTVEGVMESEGQGKRLLEEGKTADGEIYEVMEHGYKEAQAADKGDNASIWTKLALAYAIHKSFIFVRVPLTAAITPKVVKTLRGWGWNIGKRPVKKISSSSSSGTASGSGMGKTAPGTGVNTKGTGVKSD